MKIKLNFEGESHEVVSVVETLTRPFHDHMATLREERERPRPVLHGDRLDEFVALMAASRPAIAPSASVPASVPSPARTTRTIEQVPSGDYPWTPGISRDFLLSGQAIAPSASVPLPVSASVPTSASVPVSAFRPAVPLWLGAVFGVAGTSIAIGYGVFRMLPTQLPAEMTPKPASLVKPSPIRKTSQLKNKPPIAQSVRPSVRKKDLSVVFQGGDDSLLVRAIGTAEGTRTAHGGKNSAYWRHIDPGNGVVNIGSFSYQHCPSCTPVQADALQSRRLEGQGRQLLAQAKARKRVLSLDEYLNGLDLANQAPMAALDRGGFLDRLVSAPRGVDQVIHARTYSFFNPNGVLDAPGLGNSLDRVFEDQTRRTKAVRTAIDIYFENAKP